MADLPDTIKQRIALDGGKAITDELKKLGDVGEKAFAKIRSAAVKADFSAFIGNVKELGGELARVGRNVTLAFAAVGAGVAGASVAVFKVAQSSAEAADAAGKAAQKAGLQVEEYQRLAFAAEQADVSQEGFVTGLGKLSKTIVGAVNGSKPAVGLFKQLGIQIKDAGGKIRPTSDIFADIADVISKMPDGAEKSALALALFGKAGLDIVPLLNEGRDSIKRLGDQAALLGPNFTPAQTIIGDAMGDALGEVKLATRGIVAQLGLLFAPSITAGAEVIRDRLIAVREPLIELGAALRDEVLSYFKDFINLLSGNDADVTRPWLIAWRENVIGFGSDVSTVFNGVVLPLFEAVRAAAEGVATAINGMFGTEITGQQVLIAAFFAKLLGVFRLVGPLVRTVASGFKLLGSAFAFVFSGAAISTLSSFWGILVRGATLFAGFIAGLIGWPALIVAGVIAAGVAVYAFWDDIKGAAQSAWDFLVSLWNSDTLQGVFSAIGTAASAAWEAVKTGAQAAWDFLVSGFANISEKIISLFKLIGEALAPAWEVLKSAADAVWQFVLAGATKLKDLVTPIFEAVATAFSTAWAKIGAAAKLVWDTVAGGATFVFDSIVNVFSAALTKVGELVSGLVTSVTDMFTGAGTGIREAADAIVKAVQDASDIAQDVKGAEAIAAALVQPFKDAQESIAAIVNGFGPIAANGFARVLAEVRSATSAIRAEIQSILSALQAAAQAAASLRASANSGGGGGDGIQANAAGGHIRGKGTGTSDSILSWLSNGEFVIRAAAVQKFGAGFFAMLNRGVMPDLSKLRGFSVGGFVDDFNHSLSGLGIPKFANGGLALAGAGSSGGTPMQIILDGHSFDMVAADDVAGKLARHARERGMASAGKKPSWWSR